MCAPRPHGASSSTSVRLSRQRAGTHGSQSCSGLACQRLDTVSAPSGVQGPNPRTCIRRLDAPKSYWHSATRSGHITAESRAAPCEHPCCAYTTCDPCTGWRPPAGWNRLPLVQRSSDAQGRAECGHGIAQYREHAICAWLGSQRPTASAHVHPTATCRRGFLRLVGEREVACNAQPFGAAAMTFASAASRFRRSSSRDMRAATARLRRSRSHGWYASSTCSNDNR